jgi:WD40 repeat protein
MPSRRSVLSIVLLAAWLVACAAPPTPGQAPKSPAPAPLSSPATTSTAVATTTVGATAVAGITLGSLDCAVSHLSWTPDSALLAAACGGFEATDDTIHVWRSDGTLAYNLTGHTQPITDLAWSPDGRTLASSSLDETIRLWGREGTPLATWRGQAGRVFAVAWSPDGGLLASGSIVTFTQPTVQLWTPAGQIVTTLSTAYSGGKFYNLAWSPNGEYLVGGATDYKLWRADGAQIFWRQGCFSCTPAWGMAWSPNSQWWAVGDESGYVEIYTNAGLQVAALHAEAGINSLAWSPDSTRLAGANHLWRADGTPLATLSLNAPGEVQALAWSPDGQRLASGGSDAIVHLWTPDGKLLQTLAGHTAPITTLAWAPAGRLLATASADNTVRLWTVR